MLPYYNDFVSLIGVLIALSFPVGWFLYIKGMTYPSPGENYISGNPVVDFYRGIELYPRIGKHLDIKTLINCRVCLFLLQIIYLACWKANAELHQLDYTRGEINWAMTSVTVLQTIYLAKWAYWEDGYKNSIDIIVDKMGHYLAGACMTLLPSFYSLYALFLVKHSPIDGFGPIHAIGVFSLGMLSIWMTYAADRQRQIARLTGGKCEFWGKPAVVINATYKDVKGEEKKSILLCSGFWGLSRHINYFFEICLFLAWGLPVMFISPGMWLGTAGVVTMILMHRASRDNEKCRRKYKEHWPEYCERVPYKIIPYVY
jgi:7-dehydrocholesterol reductase